MPNKRPITNPAVAEMEQRSARGIEYAVDRAEFGNYVKRQLKAIAARKVLVDDIIAKWKVFQSAD